MIFKHDSDREDYRFITGEYASESNAWLRLWVEIMDRLSVMLGFGEITVTSYIRPDDDGSAHHDAKAIDGRVKDKPVVWYFGMVMIGKTIQMMNRRFRTVAHFKDFRRKQQHIHWEVRDS